MDVCGGGVDQAFEMCAVAGKIEHVQTCVDIRLGGFLYGHVKVGGGGHVNYVGDRVAQVFVGRAGKAELWLLEIALDDFDGSVPVGVKLGEAYGIAQALESLDSGLVLCRSDQDDYLVSRQESGELLAIEMLDDHLAYKSCEAGDQDARRRHICGL